MVPPVVRGLLARLQPGLLRLLPGDLDGLLNRLQRVEPAVVVEIVIRGHLVELVVGGERCLSSVGERCGRRDLPDGEGGGSGIASAVSGAPDEVLEIEGFMFSSSSSHPTLSRKSR